MKRLGVAGGVHAATLSYLFDPLYFFMSVRSPPSSPPSLPSFNLVGGPDGEGVVERFGVAGGVHVVPDHARLWRPATAAVLGHQRGKSFNSLFFYYSFVLAIFFPVLIYPESLVKVGA